MLLTAINLYQYHLPLSPSLPVATQRIDSRSGLVLQVNAQVADKALQAYAEIAPLSGLDVDANAITGFSRESLAQVQASLEAILPQLCGQHVDQLLQYAEQSGYPSLAYGLSVLHAKLLGKFDAIRPQLATIPLVCLPKEATTHSASITVHIPTAEKVTQNAIKVKVAQASMEAEISFIHAIVNAYPQCTLRLDANRGFSLAQAIDFAACLPLASIEYIEEPCQDPTDNVAFYQAIGIPYALDESLNAADYSFTMQAGLSALILKPMLLGSLENIVALIDTANEHGVRCILSSSLESSLGIADLTYLAAILTPDEIPGLDTLSAFGEDVIVSSGKSTCLTPAQLTLICQYRQQ